MAERRLKAGVVGLGVGAALMVREMEASPTFDLCAAADIDSSARERFSREFPAVRLYDGIEGLAADPDVEVVWLATPNPLHAEHSVLLANAGKHVMVQKPMALTLAEARRMVEAAERNHVKLLAGHSKAYTSPIQMMRQIVRSGELGKLCAINAFASNGWLMNTRKAEDLDPREEASSTETRLIRSTAFG